MATEIKFEMQVPHEKKSVNGGSVNWNKIFDESSTFKQKCEESCNLNKMCDAKQ